MSQCEPLVQHSLSWFLIDAACSNLCLILPSYQKNSQLLDHLEIDINDSKKAELFARFDPDGSKVVSFAEFEGAYGFLQVCGGSMLSFFSVTSEFAEAGILLSFRFTLLVRPTIPCPIRP